MVTTMKGNLKMSSGLHMQLRKHSEVSNTPIRTSIDLLGDRFDEGDSLKLRELRLSCEQYGSSGMEGQGGDGVFGDSPRLMEYKRRF